MNDLPAIIGGVALLIGTIFTGLIGLDQRRARRDAETVVDHENLSRWRPRVLRAVARMRDRFAELGIPEPEGIDDLLVFPPPRPKHIRAVKDDDEVTADD